MIGGRELSAGNSCAAEHPVAGYININKDTPNSTVSVFIYVLLPAEAAVKRVDFGEMDVS